MLTEFTSNAFMKRFCFTKRRKAFVAVRCSLLFSFPKTTACRRYGISESFRKGSRVKSRITQPQKHDDVMAHVARRLSFQSNSHA